MFDPIRIPSYKGSDKENGRSAILHHLKQHVNLLPNSQLFLKNDDALDATLCVLVGADFLRGLADPPTNLKQTQKEG